jgi:hypothetical protein
MSYDATRRAVEGFTDHVRFEQLGTQLLARLGVDVRPIGGSGDRGRDAVAGLYRALGGEPLAVTVSLNSRWGPKITADLKRLTDSGFQPADVISITNRPTSEAARAKLQAAADRDHGINLTINDRGWLVTQLHRRDNLDLRSDFLNLAPPRPRVFLDLSEYENLLERRGLLESHFGGRQEELNELERLLGEEGRTVILEADGGVGKTRLAYELARSGRSTTPWFFIDGDMAFDLDYLAELEAGYDATVLVDDAHRRSDLRQLLVALETRTPVPRLVFTVRPGHAQAIHTAVSRLALPQPTTLTLQQVGRSELIEVLQAEPFRIEREGMLRQLVAVSEGNVGIALIAARLAANGVDPTDLAQSSLFAEHTEWRLAGASLTDRESRAALALVAALVTLNLGDREEARAAADVLEDNSPRRQLDGLADAGLVVEDEPRRFTIKPDIVREHTLRFSFFPDNGRAVLRYEDVYAAFARRRLRSLLQSLGDARIDLAPGADNVLRLIRTQLNALLEQAESARDLSVVAELVRALGPGGAETGLSIAEQLLARIETLPPDDFDAIGRVLADALSAAKFGRDQLPRAWGLLLRLARISFAHEAPETRKAVVAEIDGIYSAVPINYSSADPYLLAYVQKSVSDETLAWWKREVDLSGALQVAAACVKPALVLQLEQHHQSAGNAMAISLLASFVPASAETETMLRLGARLFTETFLRLEPREQLEQLKAIDPLEHAAGGYAGILGTWPSKDLQLLAATVLTEIEAWLAEQVPVLALPVAGGVISHFAMRGRRPRGVHRVRRPRAAGELREYLDLVDSRPRTPLRMDWEKELDETRERGRQYGRDLARRESWEAVVDRWSGWIDEFESLTGNTPNQVILDALFGEVAALDPIHARALAEYAIAGERSIGRFLDSLLETLVREKNNWPLIEQWNDHPSPHVRSAAVRAVYRADDRLARSVLTALYVDSDRGVASMALQALVYGPPDGPRGWRLDLAIAAAGRTDDPLNALDQLLAARRHRAANNKPPRLTDAQKAAIRELVVATASKDRLPSHHRLAMTLSELERHTVDLTFDWLRARLDHVRRHHKTGYMQPLPDELGPFVRSRRRQAAAKAELARLLQELEKPSTDGMYRFAVDQAIEWFGDDSNLVTAKVAEWIRGGPGLRKLALSFVHSSNWKVFTRRAQLVLDARPTDADVADFLIGVRRYPGSWIGSMEPYFKSQAEPYRQWTRSRDPRLRALGTAAVTEYERLAEEAAAKERHEWERI